MARNLHFLVLSRFQRARIDFLYPSIDGNLGGR